MARDNERIDSNNLIDMARRIWWMERRLDPERNYPYDWAIVTAQPLTKPQTKTLMAIRRKYNQLPGPLHITWSTRDVLVKLLSHVRGPVMLVEGAILQWRNPTIYLDGRCGVWWDERAVVCCRKLELPQCDPSFEVINQLLTNPLVTAGDFIGTQCVECGHSATEWDRDAVPWCSVHWPKRMGEWEQVRHQWIERQDNRIPF